jgi:hypothetical protein
MIMNINLNEAVINLGKRQSLKICDGEERRIVCRRGRLWITQECDTRDIMLVPGESFTLDRRGLTLVTALQNAQLFVEERRPQSSLAVSGNVSAKKLLSRLSQAMQRLHNVFTLRRLSRYSC